MHGSVATVGGVAGVQARGKGPRPREAGPSDRDLQHGSVLLLGRLVDRRAGGRIAALLARAAQYAARTSSALSSTQAWRRFHPPAPRFCREFIASIAPGVPPGLLPGPRTILPRLRTRRLFKRTRRNRRRPCTCLPAVASSYSQDQVG